MHAGFATRTIDPPLGMPMDGFLRNSGAASIHDSLHVRLVWLRDGATQLMIAGIDLLFMDRPDVDRLKGALGRELGLLPAQVFLNFSHNHGGPRISRWHYLGEPDPAYLELLENALVAAGREARSSLRPASVEAGVGSTDLPISRRRPNAQGIAEFRPYPAGAVFRDCTVCLLRGDDGSIVSLLFSVGCHPSGIHMADITAEYPGAAVRELNARFDTVGAMFLQGPGGDAKARCLAVGEDHFRDATWDDVARMGRQLADDVQRTVAAGLRPIRPQLGAALDDVALPLCPLPIPASLQNMRDDPGTHESRRNWARDLLHRLAVTGTLPDRADIGVHHLRIGRDLAFIGIEAELGSELGMSIQRQSPSAVTFVCGYTNGSRLNLPCDRQLPEGGYGVDTFWEYHWPARLADGIDARLAAAVQAASSELQ